ncbi:hypothetical protein B296_00010987 [Ensete ventricosum]|uniref:Uncharacterized protein n=1 Tax=Ensete ventricosum TaxID=4639 RepID=A0A426ZGH2_ENSVE|nr:hypothetical protein B296_00010987 [Ensete ventricosum]
MCPLTVEEVVDLSLNNRGSNASIGIDGIMAMGVIWMPFFCDRLVVDGVESLYAAGRAAALVLRASWFSLSSCSCAKEMAALSMYEFAPCCDLLGLGDRPNLNSSKRARNLASIRISKASNLASNKPNDVMTGVGCSKGAAAIGGRRGSDVHDCCGGGQQRYGARDDCCCVQFIASRDQDWWQRTTVAGCDVNKLQRKIAAGSFLLQGSLLATIKEDGSKRSLLATLGSERCVLQLKG